MWGHHEVWTCLEDSVWLGLPPAHWISFSFKRKSGVTILSDLMHFYLYKHSVIETIYKYIWPFIWALDLALSLHVVNSDYIISKTAVEKSFVVQYTFWLKLFNAEATVGFTWYGVPICLWLTKSNTLCLILQGLQSIVFQEEPAQTGSGWINICNLTSQQPRPTSQAWWGSAGVGRIVCFGQHVSLRPTRLGRASEHEWGPYLQ